jgi:putative transposase
MPRRGRTEEQIIAALRQADSGVAVKEVCRQVGISEATFYTWKRKYAGIGVSELRELRQLREENARLKRLVADLSLDKHILQDVLAKKCDAGTAQGNCGVGPGRLPGERAPGLPAVALVPEHEAVHGPARPAAGIAAASS